MKKLSKHEMKRVKGGGDPNVAVPCFMQCTYTNERGNIIAAQCGYRNNDSTVCYCGPTFKICELET